MYSGSMSFSREKIHHFIYIAALYCIAGSLPYTIRINSLFIVILGINWLASGHLKYKLQQFYRNKYALLFSGLYLIYAAGLLYSKNLHVGFVILENKLSLLIFPLILSGYSIDKNLLERILLIFTISCFVAILISTIHASNIYIDTTDPSTFSYREALIDFFKYHPTYISIYIFFSIFIILYFLVNPQGSIPIYLKLLATFTVIYFLIVSLLLSARMPLFSFIMIMLFFICSILYQKKKFGWIILSFIILVASLYSLYQVPVVNQRLVEIAYTPLKPPVGIHHNSTNLRVGILYCSAELLKKHWLLGLGTGDMQSHLNNCYQTNQFSEVMYANNGYDPHSQYIEIWLTLGIIGLGLLIANFILPMKFAFQEKNRLYLAFLILVALCCLTESVFNTQKGVVFFAFFNSLFMFHILQNNKINKMI